MSEIDSTSLPQVTRRSTPLLKRVAGVMLIALFAIASAFGFGITPGDWQKLTAFDQAVARWQRNPDFRAVTFEYVDLGSRAMQTRLCGIRAKAAVMAFRKIPGLPKSIAVNSTSQSHYDDFAAGPWRAYFHLSAEQDVPTGIAMVEKLGANPTDGQIVAMLSGFHLPVPTATDLGAVLSVRSLIEDVKPDRAFVIHERPFGPEKLHEADGYSTQQQLFMLQSLDKELHTKNPELWRTKQVNDFLSGIWAQGYGQMYASGIAAVAIGRVAGRCVVLVFIISLVTILYGRRRAVKSAIVSIDSESK
jgi:hypothetical protein